jgi:transcriptional regulator with XRE-family HTH domain
MTNKTLTPEKWIGKKKNGEVGRFQLFLADSGVQLSDISNKTGVSDRTLKNVIYEEAELGNKLLRGLHHYFGVSIDWIVSGSGSMYINSEMVAEPQTNYGSVDTDREQRIISFLEKWLPVADEDEKAWLEIELKVHIKAYQDHLNG